MPRPRVNRRVRHRPPASFYKPQGVPLGLLRGVTLTLDGLEAIRLADAEGLEHATAAALMGISRPTFSRLLAEARAIVARGLVNGWAIRIEGGNCEFADGAHDAGLGRRRRRGWGGRGGMGSRPAEAAAPDDAGASGGVESRPRPSPAFRAPEETDDPPQSR